MCQKIEYKINTITMDSYEQYKKQLEYEKYINNQKKNFVDLSTNVDDPNDSIKLFAEWVFNKREMDLTHDFGGLLLDQHYNVADIFCMLLEIFLYGHNIVTEKQSTIFDLKESTDDLVCTIKNYFKSFDFDIFVKEINDTNINANNFKYTNDCYCYINLAPHILFKTEHDWWIANYELKLNPYFTFTDLTTLPHFKAYFISNDNKIFAITFDLKN